MSQGKVHIGIGSELRAIAEGSTCPDTLKAIADEVDQMEREHEAMQHDIARMMEREAELLKELDRYRNGFQGACEPVAVENKRLRSALAMIREITGQDAVFHEADSALAGQGGEG